jgi:ribonucleoside-triphosphate reductase
MSPRKLERTPCEVYSRVTGYMRPVSHWNDGKKAEFLNRKTFKLYETS